MKGMFKCTFSWMLIMELKHVFGRFRMLLVKRRMDFIDFLICDAGNALTRTLDHLTTAFSSFRPNVEQAKAYRGATCPVTGHTARTHNYTLFRFVLMDLDQSRFLGIIIRSKKRLVDALPGVRLHRALGCIPNAHSRRQIAGDNTHTHTRTRRAPDSTAIT